MFIRSRSNKNKYEEINLLTDEELIQAYRDSKEVKYVGELFDRNTHLIFGVCMKHLKDVDESKDAVMEIFETLHQKLSAFQIASFKNWIFTVSRNHCLMILRKKTAHRKHHLEIYENSKQKIMENAVQSHPFEVNEKEQKMNLMKRGIELLREEQRRCIELLYLQEKSYKEVSQITGYDMKKVKSYVQNGKRNLRIFLENK